MPDIKPVYNESHILIKKDVQLSRKDEGNVLSLKEIQI